MMLVRRGYRTAEEARAVPRGRRVARPVRVRADGGGRRPAPRRDRCRRQGRRSTATTTSTASARRRSSSRRCGRSARTATGICPTGSPTATGSRRRRSRRLADRGTRVLVTADCGIACPDEVALARDLGIEPIVTDHHVPGERLPDCPILHPRVSGYPFAELCATGVAYKLACALRERAGVDAGDAGSDLDLVALATVADLVPLHGENRALVREGLAEARRSRRPGMRALVAASGAEIERLDEGDLAFRLAPRINAAGRLYRADAGVELMLDRRRGARGRDRGGAEPGEQRARASPSGRRSAAPRPRCASCRPSCARRPGSWSPARAGTRASSASSPRGWSSATGGRRSSSRSTGRVAGAGRAAASPASTCSAALEACAEHLVRFGGHRAAAGLELEAARLEEFRRAFAEHAHAVLGPGGPRPHRAGRRVVGGESLGPRHRRGARAAGPVRRRAIPEPRLLVPAARVRDVRPMGEEGRHARFSLDSGASERLGVAFGVNGELDRAAAGGPVDVAVKLELNHWNGAVEPRVVLRDLYAARRGPGPPSPAPEEAIACNTAAGPDEWWAALRRRAAPLEPRRSRVAAVASRSVRARRRRSPWLLSRRLHRRAPLDRRSGARPVRRRLAPPRSRRQRRRSSPLRRR